MRKAKDKLLQPRLIPYMFFTPPMKEKEEVPKREAEPALQQLRRQTGKHFVRRFLD